MLLKQKKIFVVEDNAANLAVIATILRNQGAIVPFMTWGGGAIARMIQTLPIDLILLDLMLPKGVSGYDIFDQIRATPKLAKIPVVIITASDSSTEMNRAREKGLNGFIAKPLDFHRFGRQIAKILNGEEVWGDY